MSSIHLGDVLNSRVRINYVLLGASDNSQRMFVYSISYVF